ncbi:MAG TPA: alpha/beta hydrolase-fold protein [Steroidobacteraceae bacterium]|nr:alpha/beta hydrolase-fold protein [Steroidobacteraceae bacterium]
MQKESWSWATRRLPDPARLVRWGHFGTPVLLFPTAGADFEEVERFQLIAALGGLIEQGRIKVYSVDGLAVRAWLASTLPPEGCARLQDRYDEFLSEEIVPRIRQDCQAERIEPIVAGASLGAFSALAALCKYPQQFRASVGLSGVYDLAPRTTGVSSESVGAFTPARHLAALSEGAAALRQLRGRQIILGTGEGPYETPAESRALASLLQTKQVPCHLRLEGSHRDHDWSAWRELLPAYLRDIA